MKNNWKTWAILGVVIAVSIVVGDYFADQRFKMSQKKASKGNPAPPVNQEQPMYADQGGF